MVGDGIHGGYCNRDYIVLHCTYKTGNAKRGDAMSRIITIGREFGSGGRELGRCPADLLHMEFYHKKIVTQIAKRTPFTEKYLEEKWVRK